MKKAPNSKALSGLRAPHRNSPPGPVNETAREMTDAARKNLAIIFMDTVFALFATIPASAVLPN